MCKLVLKKALSLIVVAAMLVSTMAFTTNAADTLIFSDNFDNGFKPVNWLTDRTICHYEWDKYNGCIHGYDDATVLQSNYGAKYNKCWDQFYGSFDFQIRAFDDLPEQEGRMHGVSIWYRDLMEATDGEQSGAAYFYNVEIETGKAILRKEHSWDYYDENGVKQEATTNAVIAEGNIGMTIEVGESAPFYEMGIRVTEGKIECYFEKKLILTAEVDPDDPKYGDFTMNSVDATVGSQKSAFLIWNHGNWIAIDNFEVRNTDYDPTHVHLNTEFSGYVEPTCTTAGTTGDTICTECGETIATGTEIPATGHSWDEGVVTVEPTYDTTGIKLFTCNICGDTLTEEIPTLENDNSDFTIDENGVLTSYTGIGGDVVIPDGVTAIGEQAFALNNTITSVTIPENVTEIGEGAFVFCKNLETVILPSTLEVIGNGVFAFCYALTDVELPESVTELGTGAFAGCTSLEELLLPVSITSMGEDVFEGCAVLTLRCYSGSISEAYALDNDIPYEVVDESIVITGDVNGDGDVNANDLAMLMRFLKGANIAVTNGADINNDGSIDNIDLSQLKRILKGVSVG